ncbi:hypothetical protein F4782DRAFT_204879 [Xylaria castorea]|nr:hypothetical protein F4782DRAFT_204879 [Xylaria castorea]
MVEDSTSTLTTHSVTYQDDGNLTAIRRTNSLSSKGLPGQCNYPPGSTALEVTAIRVSWVSLGLDVSIKSPPKALLRNKLLFVSFESIKYMSEKLRLLSSNKDGRRALGNHSTQEVISVEYGGLHDPSETVPQFQEPQHYPMNWLMSSYSLTGSGTRPIKSHHCKSTCLMEYRYWLTLALAPILGVQCHLGSEKRSIRSTKAIRCLEVPIAQALASRLGAVRWLIKRNKKDPGQPVSMDDPLGL